MNNDFRKRRASDGVLVGAAGSTNFANNKRAILAELTKIKEERDKIIEKNKKLKETFESVRHTALGHVNHHKELCQQKTESEEHNTKLRKNFIEADKRLDAAQKENGMLRMNIDRAEGRFNALTEQTVEETSTVDASNLRNECLNLNKRLVSTNRKLVNEQNKNKKFHKLHTQVNIVCGKNFENLEQKANSEFRNRNYKTSLELFLKAMGIEQVTSASQAKLESLQNRVNLCYDHLSRTEFIASEGVVMRKELEQKIIQVQNKATIAETNLGRVRKGVSVLINQNKDLQMRFKLAEQKLDELKSGAATLKDNLNKRSIECGRFYQQILNADHRRNYGFDELKNGGEALLNNGRHTDALELYIRAIGVEELARQNPDYLAFLWNQVAVCWANGFNRPLKALQAINNAIRHSSSNSLYFFTRALLTNKMGNTRAAIGDLQTAIHIRPDFVEAKNFLNNLLGK